MEQKKNILISFSGGRTSAYMTKLMMENNFFANDNKIVVFANTGKELEETLVFVNECDKRWNLGVVWIEALPNPIKGKGTDYKIVTFETANRDGRVFEDVIKIYGLPSKLYRHCTRELKEVPIHKYAKDIFGTKKYLTAIGIRADEKHRVGKGKTNIYPLNEAGVDEVFIRNWWDKQGFDLKLKDYEGNCDLCFLKAVRKKGTIINEKPNIANWWANMEEKYTKERQPIFDVYRDLSLPNLIDYANSRFRLAEDKHEVRKLQNSLFEIDLDEDFDCFCK